MQIFVESQLDRSTDQFFAKLDEHNEPFIGPRKTEEFGLTMRNEEGNIVAGVVAQCVYNWLHINVIWVSEDLRGQGHGDTLIEAAEAEGNAGAVKTPCCTPSVSKQSRFMKNTAIKILASSSISRRAILNTRCIRVWQMSDLFISQGLPGSDKSTFWSCRCLPLKLELLR